ncbi:MAG: Multicopper oxidase [Candidatus Angelobacter sp.]|jgi:FtsP/CotA-like multicopper oxidase with cupredoxin domain|nr:Multicopper oxidase [Candidatus Angelobacter sp.]
MKSSRRIFSAFFAGMFIFAIAQMSASAQTAVAPVANPCPRLAPGSVLHNPPSLFSQKGVLVVNFSYQTTTDADGRTLFCFMTPDGKQNPTLHVRPGDHLIVNVTNNVPASGGMSMAMSAADQCGDSVMTATSMNIHYHGTNTAPICHQDEVIHTIINSGQSFQYNLAFPSDEPPGLYWYHPHIHGIAEPAVQGGASGAIVVEGLENLQPSVAGLRQRVLVLRDQVVAGGLTPGGDVPAWDLTLNNIPIAYPALTPAIMRMRAGERQLWRFTNSSADSLVDLQVLFDGVPQTLQIVGLDGVPTGSQDGTRQGSIVPAKHILVPTAGRAEFIVSAPPSTVKNAVFMTRSIDTGPAGDNDTQRTLATIRTFGTENNDDDGIVPTVNAAPGVQRFEGLKTAAINTRRKLYFSEVISDPSDPSSPTNFFITVEGATPTMFDPANPPAIITTQGQVEDWTIENRAVENHEFHFHQIHFLVLAQSNFQINGSQPQANIDGQFLDMIQIPYWDGNPKHPYPSVKVRMDFRGADIGDFVYHCHILGHEDNGMMSVIRVLPAASSKQSTPTPKATASIQTNDSTSAPIVTPASGTETIDRTFMPSWTELDMLK